MIRKIIIALSAYLWTSISYGELTDSQRNQRALDREKSMVCDYMYDAAGSYMDLKKGRAYSTGVTFHASLCLFKDDPSHVAGRLIDDNDLRQRFFGGWQSHRTLFGRAADGRFVMMEVIGSIRVSQERAAMMLIDRISDQ